MHNNTIKLFLTNKYSDIDENLIRKSCGDMDHEGSKNISTYSDNDFCIGTVSRKENATPSIAWNHNKNMAVVMVGNIFGYENLLRKSDCLKLKLTESSNVLEFLLYAFEKHGDKIALKLNGIFTVIFYDLLNKEITLINDRCGFHPMYYYYKNNNFIISSEVNPITSSKAVKKIIDWKSWSDLIYLSSINGNNTLFKNIKAVPSASVLKFKNNKISINKYWDLNNISQQNINIDDAVTETIRLLKNSIKLQTSHLKKADVFLSGGHDSRCITGLLNQANINIDSYTSQKEFGKRDDKVIAKILADSFGMPNYFIDLPADMYSKYYERFFNMQEGMSDENFWLMPLYDGINDTEIGFDGLGGDILFGKPYINKSGLDDFFKTKKYYDLAKNIIDRRNNRKLIFDSFVDKTFQPDIAKIIKNNIQDSIVSELQKIKNIDNILSIFLFTNKIRRGVSLGPCRLAYPKKEIYFPFLDNDLVEFSLSIKHLDKINNDFYDKVISSINKNLAQIPYSGKCNDKLDIPQRKLFPHKQASEINFIKNLFRKDKLEKDILLFNPQCIYPGSKYVHFYMWYNKFFK